MNFLTWDEVKQAAKNGQSQTPILAGQLPIGYINTRYSDSLRGYEVELETAPITGGIFKFQFTMYESSGETWWIQSILRAWRIMTNTDECEPIDVGGSR